MYYAYMCSRTRLYLSPKLLSLSDCTRHGCNTSIIYIHTYHLHQSHVSETRMMSRHVVRGACVCVCVCVCVCLCLCVRERERARAYGVCVGGRVCGVWCSSPYICIIYIYIHIYIYYLRAKWQLILILRSQYWALCSALALALPCVCVCVCVWCVVSISNTTSFTGEMRADLSLRSLRSSSGVSICTLVLVKQVKLSTCARIGAAGTHIHLLHLSIY